MSGNASIMLGTCCKGIGSANVGTSRIELLCGGILSDMGCWSAGTCTVGVMSTWATSECSGLGGNVCAICSGPLSNVRASEKWVSCGAMSCSGSMDGA